MGDGTVESDDASEPDARAAESPVEAIVEGAATGSLVGPLGLVGGIVAGWLISRIARRRGSGGG